MTIVLGFHGGQPHGWLAPVPSWEEPRIWRLGSMMIPAPEPCPDTNRPAGDSAAGIKLAGNDGVVVALPCRGDQRLGGAGAVRRLRVAAPVQLELVSAREGPGPEVVWASLSEHSREAVLVMLARLIGAGAVGESEEEGER